ncbi:MAG: ATP-binding protein [Flavobacteriales bacterium]|jgi:nicotinamide riboside kinase|nr:ATP-binding protein [Flavobacteriales bacterium]
MMNNHKFRIVITGVENSGKSTLIKPLAEKFNWPFIIELCRENEAVLNGTETFETLKELHRLEENKFEEIVNSTSAKGVFCDTAGLVLDLWAESVFGKSVTTKSSSRKIDLYLLCETIEKWEDDPIRLIPNHQERVEKNNEFRARLEFEKAPYIYIPVMPLEERVEFAERKIKEILDV